MQANFGGAQRLQAEPKSLLDSQIGLNELHFPMMHEKRDFLNAVKTRGATLEDAEVGHRTASLGHLGQIAIQLGRKLKWDPDKEVFIATMRRIKCGLYLPDAARGRWNSCKRVSKAECAFESPHPGRSLDGLGRRHAHRCEQLLMRNRKNIGLVPQGLISS